jgi:MFS family permease
LYIARIVAGIGIGGEFTAVYAMVDEIVPSTYRGTVNVCVSSLWHLGSVIAGCVSLLFNSRLTSLNDRHTWKYLSLIGAIFMIPIIYIRKYLPESPRWIFGKNKQSEAEVVVDLISYCSEHDCIIPLEE